MSATQGTHTHIQTHPSQLFQPIVRYQVVQPSALSILLTISRQLLTFCYTMWSHLLVSLICIAGVQSRMCGTRSPTQELVQFHKRYNAMNIGGYIEPQTPFEVDTWFHYIFPGPLNFMDKFRSEWHTKDQVYRVFHSECFANANLFLRFLDSGSQ